MRFGPARGFVQIPRAGGSESTSGNRPTFSELGFSAAFQPEARISLGWERHAIVASARFTRHRERVTLEERLVTHGADFPAGTSATAGLELDWYWAGYRYRLGGGEFSATPGAGVGLLHLDYRLGDESRAFSLAAPVAFVSLEWNPPGDLSFALEFAVAPPVPRPRTWISAELAARLRLGAHGRLVFGVSAERFDFRDTQDTPNHLRADFGPSAIFGAELRF